MRVPVSIRSGITPTVSGRRLDTPSIVMVAVPAPRMRAPIRPSARASSTTSGSRAAFSMIVTPSASEAAMRMFSVPVTETVSK